MENRMDNAAKSLHVDLGDRSYDIVIGESLIARLGELIAPHTPHGRVAIITDENVNALYGKAVAAALADYETHLIVRPAGEAQKSMAGLNDVLESLFRAGLDRSDMVLALGGGVIGDLAGFAASIYKRGIPFIQIPTTLLAQVDSSVGGKTAINSPFGKNLIGSFYQPQLVIADIDVLSTLAERQIKAGYAEVLKYGLLGDAAFFERLDAGQGAKILALDKPALQDAIAVSCETKARIVAADERESGQRALLNLGHSFAHIFELAAGYDGDLLHGEAVSAGMQMAFEFSAQRGLCEVSDVTRVHDHLAKLSMPMPKDMAPYLNDIDALMGHLSQDKKNERGALTFILTRGIGEAFVQRDVSPESVYEYLENLKDRYA
ncbi:3-dehydroquinate synthase [Litorimonas sp. RW-G-Af-16]|uniref:3-dehydroquinate synthase n=1 Tax=Litorimonas sp. RW-G-Af-16 TaxID=3241168 RepID=UPI00390C6B41